MMKDLLTGEKEPRKNDEGWDLLTGKNEPCRNNEGLVDWEKSSIRKLKEMCLPSQEDNTANIRDCSVRRETGELEEELFTIRQEPFAARRDPIFIFQRRDRQWKKN